MSTFDISSRPVWLSHGRIPALDGLRAVAILLVVFAHVIQTHGFPDLGSFRKIAHMGTLGVDIFFVLSGFLITTLLCREWEQKRRISLRDFYLRRAYRILPAYGFYLAFIAVLQAFGLAVILTRDWIAAMTFTMNFQHRPAWEVGHLWSLSIEEHYYFLWPLALAVLSKKNCIRLLFVLLLVQPVIRWIVVLRFPDWSPMTDLWTFTRFDSIGAGSLLALLSRDDARRRQLDRLARWWPLILFILIFGLCLGMISGKLGVGVTPSSTAISLSLLVWTAARRGLRILESRLIVAIGLGSYSLYLWQQVFLNPHSTSDMARFPLNVILACFAALVSYQFVEQPFLRFKERRQKRSTQSMVLPKSHDAETSPGNTIMGGPFS